MVLVDNYKVHHQKWLQCFNDPKRSDAVFEPNDGQTFHCEKFVLEVASPYFERLFSRGKDSTKFFTAKDVDPSALKWILRSCYTGDGDLNDDNVVSVMLAAKMYEMSWVSQACMKYLKEDKGGPVAAFEYSHDLEKWQEWKVPQSGWYHIVAMGAKAADQTIVNAQLYKSKGGEGAIVGGSFELEENDIVQILTEGMSRVWLDSKHPNFYTGGGEGTFVALKARELSLLLAAGGGGSVNKGFYGSDANLGGDGIGSGAKWFGGKDGGNGATNGPHLGGLGWKAGPAALAKPRTADLNDNGGFGGGGDLCGGGGGYSGGAAGSSVGGGGGGSCIASEAVNSWKKVGSLGHGKVSIWKGKKVPAKDTFFLEQVGKINDGPQIQTYCNGEAIDSWEMLD